MHRANDIKQKLAYTLSKYNDLTSQISNAQKKDEEIPFIGDKTGDILSGCRECFDYCARDIVDSFIANKFNKKTQVNKKIYFPYNLKQLSDKGSVFFELSNTNPALHKHLLDLSAKIENKHVIPNTMINYSLIRELNDIVNSKKHDKIISTIHRENSATRVTFPDGADVTISPLFPVSGDTPDFGADIDAMSMVGAEGVEIKYVKEYRLEYNNWEATTFCLHSIQLTHIVLSEIYQKAFGISIKHFDPWETLKEPVQHKETINHYDKPLAVRRKICGEQHSGDACYQRGEYKKAIEYYEKALAINLKTYGVQNPEVAKNYSSIGNAWDELGDYKKAIECHEKALTIHLKAYGEQHPEVAKSYNSIGAALCGLGKYKKAIGYHEKALTIRLKAHGEQHPDAATSYNNIGVAWTELWKCKKGIEYNEKALAIRLKIYGERHPEVAKSYNSIGCALYGLGEYKKGIEYHEKALAIRLKTYGKQHPEVAGSYNNIGVGWYELDEYQKAIEYHEKALAISIRIFGSGHPLTRRININLERERNPNKGKLTKFLRHWLRLHCQ